MRKFNFINKVMLFMLLLICLILTGCSASYTITLNYEDGSLYKTVTVKEDESLKVDDPIKEGHTFDGWYLESNKVTGETKFTNDTTLVAKFTINQYTYKFIVDGEVIKEVKDNYGSEIEYPSNPKKDGTQENKFVFVKWDNEAKTLLKDETFNAVFETEKNVYEYVFMNDDGTIIKEQKAEYGSTIVYPENPTKQETDEFIYTFEKWDRDETVLTEDIVFIASYTSVKKQYTYKFVSDDTIIKEETVDYGTMPTEPTDIPAKEETAEYKYVFAGWDKSVSIVTENVTYTAVFNEIPKSQKIEIEGKTISILGDSISTFYAEGSEMNSSYSGENQFYYPRYSSTIKTVDKTWWYQLIKNANLKLGVNNSWSGSCAAGGLVSSGTNDDRINMIDDNGTPDIVIIYLGTNDCAGGFTVESYKDALEVMITKIRKLCNAQIFLTTLGYTNYTGNKYKEENRLIYNETIRLVAENYNCGIVPLDEYIVEDNYMFYLQDFLHYNAEGAKLLSKIYEKSIKEYNDIEFTEEIKVLHQEKLPEGVIAQITATANTGFWTGYASNVYLFKASSSENPTYSTRIEFKLDTTDNKYYVSNIVKSGDSVQYSGDYVLIISDGHEQSKMLVDGLADVKVGNLVEFDLTMNFPVKISFKDGKDISGDNPDTDLPDDEFEEVEGKLHIGAYNEGVWSKYETTIIAYSHDKMDQGSTYINFYIIKLTKDQSSDKYLISGLKTVNDSATFEACDYYILIYSQLNSKTYYENAKLGDKVIIEGDITSGNCYLVFE